MEKKHTTASGEDYLEAILMLQQKHGTVRSVDVSHQLEVSKASVSYAVTTLRQGGFLTMEDDFEACRMEHTLSEESFQKLKQSVERKDTHADP